MVTKSRLIAGVVALTMVLSLVGAGASSAMTIQDMIQALVLAGVISPEKAAAALTAVGGSTAPVATNSGYKFTKDLTLKSTGADVTALQEKLVAEGYLTMPAGTAYGYFGEVTKKAVIQYQLANKITPAAGYVGPKTMVYLNAGSTAVTPGPVTTGTDLKIALAATSPAAGTIITGQAAANLAEYTFTNTSSVPAVVTNVSLERKGVSGDTALANVYLFKGATRLTDSATVSAGKITFNAGSGIFTVPAGASVTIAVKADVLASVASGQTVWVNLLGATSNVPVTGSQISGAAMTFASASDISVLTLASTTVSSNMTAGTLNQTIWGASFNATQRFVWLKSLAVKVIGSIPSDSLQNIKLYVSGVQVATASGIDANGIVTFDLSGNPYKIDSSRNLEIRADIVNGSSRKFTVSLQNAADIQVVDSNYNVGIAAIGIPVIANEVTVDAGNLSVQLDSTLSSGDVVLGSSNVTLARYTLKAYGENEKVSYFNVSANADLTNVALYANGVSISSSQNVASTGASTLFSLGSSLIINANQSVTLEIKGDLKNSAGVNTATSSAVVVSLKSYPSNTLGSYSSTAGTYPTSPISGPTMTVVGGGLTVAKNSAYNDTTLTANTTNFKVGSFVLSSNSSEPVRVTSLVVGLTGSAGNTSTLPLTSLSNLKISESSSSVNPQSSNNFGVDFTIAANSSKTVDVFADIGNIASVANAADTQTLVTAETVPGVAIVPAVAASGTVTVSNQLTVGQIASTTINGVKVEYTAAGTVSSTTAAANLAALVNASQAVVTASSVGGVITLTANTAGTVGNLITTTAGGTNTTAAQAVLAGGTAATSGTARQVTLTPANVEVGDVFTAVIGGTSVSFTATAATVANVTAGLTAAINSAVSSQVTAVNGTTIVTLTSVAKAPTTPVVTSSATNGTHSTTNALFASLTVTASGVNSNVDASAAKVNGQTLTVGTGALATPTLVSTSPQSQLVIGPSTNSNVGTFNFKASTGAATINELSFTTTADSAAITSITVGGVTKTVSVNATTTISGLNIIVPVSNSGKDIPVTVAYNTVGTNGIASNVAAQLNLTSVKFTTGNSTQTQAISGVSANAMTPVAAYPNVAIVASTRTGLVNSASPVKIADITVSAVGNTVNMTTIGVTVTGGASATIATAALTLKDGNTAVAATAGNGNAGSNSDLVFTGTGYKLSAGQSKTFGLYATVSGAATGVGTDTLTTQLSAAANLDWDDVEGAANGLHADLIPSYDTSVASVLTN